jgi:hypothetical protein
MRANWIDRVILIWSENGRCVKLNNQPPVLQGLFFKFRASSRASWRLSWEVFRSYVGRCWIQDCVFQGGRCSGILELRSASRGAGQRILEDLGMWLEPRTEGTTLQLAVVRLLAHAGSHGKT